MRILLTILIFSLLALGSIFSQVSIIWETSIGGPGADIPRSLIVTKDNGYLLGGFTEAAGGDVSLGYGEKDFWLVKFDESGTVIWEKTFGGSGIDDLWELSETKDGNYIIVGTSNSNDGDISENNGNFDYWVIKVDQLGNLIWEKTFGGINLDEARSVVSTSDGGFIIVGNSPSSDDDLSGQFGTADYWVLKFSVSAELEWEKYIGGGSQESAYSIIETKEGTYVITGHSSSRDGDAMVDDQSGDVFITCLFDNGEIKWTNSYGGSYLDYAYQIKQSKDGGFIVAGSTYSTDGDIMDKSDDSEDAWILKLFPDGELEWSKTFGYLNSDKTLSVIELKNDGFVFCGSTQSEDGEVSFSRNLWLFKINDLGLIEWEQTFGGALRDEGWSVVENDLGNLVAAGSSFSNDGDLQSNNGVSDYWILELESSTTSNQNFDKKERFEVYPNPVVDIINISSEINLDGANFEMYNFEGKICHAGKLDGHTFTIDRALILPGVYLFSVANDRHLFSKVILVD